MSAMSASPVKPPVLPPSGVNVQPPQVATSPQKVVLGTPLPIPSTLTISPAKPANMNHAAMPLSLIADHKIASQYPPQSQPAIPPPVMSAMQPISQPLPRTPEKPKELSAPAPAPSKPTSNGMENLIPPIQAPTLPPAILEPQQSAGGVPIQKPEILTPSEPPETKVNPVVPEKPSEPPVAAIAPPVEADIEKKEVVTAKPVEPATAPAASSTTPQESTKTPAATTAPPKVSSATPSPATASTPAVANPVTSTAPAPAPTPTPAAATAPEKPSASTPAAEQATPQPVVPAVTPSISRTESSVPQSKPEMKVATIPRQAAKRKRESKVPAEQPEVKKEGKDDDRKSKRVRLPTQPYQSPIPELNIIAKIDKKIKSTPTKAADDKLIVFYKNEFLAVRNAEGGFYVCQAMQNIYKSSPRIRIRWLSQEEGKDTYSPDFYDHTDFDCILTNLNLDKVDKEKFKLPQVEQQRTESILKRALDVEKGVSEKPPVTEEHPDGLDLSLFRDESQLKKSKGRGKKLDGEKSDDKESISTDDDIEEEKKPKKTPTKSNKRKKKSVKKKPAVAEKKAAAKTTTNSNKPPVQPKKKTETRELSKRKASVSSSTQSQPPEKRTRKSESSSTSSSERTNKTRSVEGVAVAAKSRRDRRVKTRK